MNEAGRRQQRLISSFTAMGKGGSIAAAVSGGVDSVAMLLLLAHYCRMNRLRLCVFHVDHALREDSEADRHWVEELSGRLGLAFFWRRATDADKIGSARPGSEAWARNFRYSCFAQMLEESGAEIVATGHTADDQAETLLMRMLRGCGVAGAGGIRSRRRLAVNGRPLWLWRPLLNIERHELLQYLAAAGQKWREDETNNSEVYFRNMVRHRIMPVMKSAAPTGARHFSELAEEIQQLHTMVMRLARLFLKRHQDTKCLDVTRVPPAFLRREVIRLWLIEAGLGENANRRLIGQIDELWRKKGGGRRVLCGSMVFSRRQNRLILTESSL
ncbi:MAG: tRNA(Ile)-lysidine synthetase [Candidatus Rifleibacterium amylolyticum]|nr:MAG: tRNA(Ile)-lysidine synthetase [Candidatus Rifleibacterium amylolyticum]